MGEREREREIIETATLKLPRGFHGQSVRNPGLEAILKTLYSKISIILGDAHSSIVISQVFFVLFEDDQ